VRHQQRAAAVFVAAPAPVRDPDTPPMVVGAVTSGVTVEKAEEETLGQLRDRLDLGGSAQVPASGPCATCVMIKVKDTSGQDTDDEGEVRGGRGRG